MLASRVSCAPRARSDMLAAEAEVGAQAKKTQIGISSARIVGIRVAIAGLQKERSLSSPNGYFLVRIRFSLPIQRLQLMWKTSLSGRSELRRSWDFKVVAALFSLAVLIGGAGVNFPLLQMALCLSALLALGYFCVADVPDQGEFSRPLVWLIAAVFALGLAQLVPLPPSFWHTLPGRASAVELDSILGWRLWRPLSFDSEGTIRSLLVLIPSAIIAIGAMRLSRKEKIDLLYLFVALALLNALLGLVQLTSGGRVTPYPSAHSGFPIGLFVNRNHQAALLLAAIPVTAALGALNLVPTRPRLPVIAVSLSLIIIFAIVTVATTSRMALLLLGPTALVSLAILFARQSIQKIILPSAAIITAVVVTVWLGGGLERNFARFSSLSDSRVNYWTDVAWALEHYGLVGTGLGTFVPVQKTAESLSTVTPSILNHAHNDYIEVLLEGGIPALLLLFCFICLLGYAAVRVVRTRFTGPGFAVKLAAFVAMAEMLVFSLVDYPLRMPAIAGCFALCLIVFLPSPHNDPQPAPQERAKASVKQPAKWAQLACVAAIALVALQAGISRHLLLSNQPEYAMEWAPWSTEARSRSATDELLVRRDPVSARSRALSALRLSPIDAPAIRTVGAVDALQGDTQRGARLLRLATVLGWRDAPTNLWAIGASIDTGEPLKAAQRAEALFRQHQYLPTATGPLLLSGIGPQASELLVRQLQDRPDWRWGFLRSLGDLPNEALPKAVELIERLNRTKSPASIEEAQPLLDRLDVPEGIEVRRRLWQSLHAGGLIANGDFEDTSDYRGPEMPRNWDISSSDFPSLLIDEPGASGRGKTLRIYHAYPGSPLIAQTMMLNPGAYQLSFNVRSERGEGGRLQWELRCLDTGSNSYSEVLLAPHSKWQRATTSINVPNRNCLNQRLALQLIGVDNATLVWIDDVVLRPALISR